MQLKKLLWFALLCNLLFFSKIYAQQNFKSTTIDTSQNKINKPEIFSSGFIDVMNNGQVNAFARFIKLFIGEPGKFSIPLSFYGGVSSNNFQNQNNAVP